MLFKIVMEERFVRQDAVFTVDVEFFEATHLSRGTTSGLLRDATLTLPGFREQSRVVSNDCTRLSVRGTIGRPGFYALKVTLDLQGQTFTQRDYVTVLPAAGQEAELGAFGSYGYYVFLTRKGFALNKENAKLGEWAADEWKRFIDWMSANGAEQLWFVLNCYYLGYPSKRFPELVDTECRNAKDDFLGEVIEYAHEHGVKVYLAFGCDDYATGFCAANPETMCLDSTGNVYNKTACCLEMEKVRAYILGVVEEAVNLYPKADGIVIHPNEEGQERFNPETARKFQKETGTYLTLASDSERYTWYAEKAAELIADMHTTARKVRDDIECVALNVHWLDDYAEAFSRKLPETAKMCVWHYLHHGSALENPKHEKWRKQFQPERLIYMPNGFDYRYPSDPDARWLRHIGNDILLSKAQAIGYRECVYYVHHRLASKTDRMRDLIMAKYPSSSWLENASDRDALIAKLYEDYFGTRDSIALVEDALDAVDNEHQ